MPEVPKIIHFITSAKTASAQTAARIKRWVAKNPGWKAIVWCDPATMGANNAVLSAQNPSVEVKPIDVNAAPIPLGCCSGADRTGFAASSEVLRYQILLKNGGCYFDSDLEPGDPLPPTLTVSADTALFATAKPGGPRDAAVACVAGSHRIQQLGQQAVVQCQAAAASPAPAANPSAPDASLDRYVQAVSTVAV